MVSTLLFTFVISLLLETCYGAALPKDSCIVSVNKHLSDPQPLLLLQNGATIDIEAFPLPEDDDGTLTFTKGQTIDIACPRRSIVISNSNTGKDLLEAKCNGGIKFVIHGQSVPLSDIKCTDDTYHIARYNGNKCANNKHKEIEIGFQVGKRFIKHITSCFDSELQNVLYAQSYLSSTIAGFQVGYPRPDDFLTGPFYNVKPDNVNYLYTRKGQRKTINKALGLKPSDTSIIHPSNNYFLAKGHYTAKSDFVFGSQQRLTFYYVNVAPQWQTLNGGNWNVMENDCRYLASSRNVDLTIYAGSHGITTLLDTNGKEQELYLWINSSGKKGLPVPAIFYRVVYDPKTKAGIALIGVNNPYQEDVKDYIICKDVCEKVSWLKWKRHDIKRGYGYCCDVNDFRKTVNVLPQFEVRSLLI